jgi:hypothetical protein
MVIEIKERSTTTRLAAASYDGSSSVAHTHTPRQQTSPSIRLVVSWRAWSVVITLSPPWVGDRWSFQYVLWCALCVRACLNWTLVGRAHPVSSWLQCRVARRRRRGNAAPALLGAVAFSLSRRTSRAERFKRARHCHPSSQPSSSGTTSAMLRPRFSESNLTFRFGRCRPRDH